MKRRPSAISRYLKKLAAHHKTDENGSLGNDWELLIHGSAGQQGESWYRLIHPGAGRKL